MRPVLATVFAVFWLSGCICNRTTPWIGAARSGDTKTLKTLLAGGADPNLPVGRE